MFKSIKRQKIVYLFLIGCSIIAEQPMLLYASEETAEQKPSSWYYPAFLQRYVQRARETTASTAQTIGKGAQFIGQALADITHNAKNTLQALSITTEYNRMQSIQKTITILQNDMNPSGKIMQQKKYAQQEFTQYIQNENVPIIVKLNVANKLFIQTIHTIKEKRVLLKTFYLVRELAEFIQNINYFLTAIKPFSAQETQQLLQELQKNITKFFNRISRLMQFLVHNAQLKKIEKTINKYKLPTTTPARIEHKDASSQRSFFSTIFAARQVNYTQLRDDLHTFFTQFNTHFHNINIVFDDIETKLSTFIVVDPSSSPESIIDFMKKSLSKDTVYEGFFSLMNDTHTTIHILLNTIEPIALAGDIVTHILQSFRDLIKAIDQNVAQKIDPNLSRQLQDTSEMVAQTFCSIGEAIIFLVGEEGLQDIKDRWEKRRLSPIQQPPISEIMCGSNSKTIKVKEEKTE